MEERSGFESQLYEEYDQSSANHASDHGWQKVSYSKRQRKPQQSKQSPDLDPARLRPGSPAGGGDRSAVFRSLELHAEERIRLRALKESQQEAAEIAARAKPTGGGGVLSSDDGGDSDADAHGGTGETKAEAKKQRAKKPKKPKVTVAEAAAKIDSTDLALFLLDVSASYEDKQDIQLMRFTDYFARAFSSVSASQFPWTKMLKETPVSKTGDIPLCYISEPVYKTSVDWISKHSVDALGEFFLWLLDSILSDLANQQALAKNSKKSSQHAPLKAQVAIFAVLAMVVRQKPDILISQLSKLRDDPKYQGQDKLPIYVWVICQASFGDLVIGMYAWVRNLLPVIVSGNQSSNPQARDLVLQLAERILLAPKARPILFNGVVRKGERLVPPPALELLLRATFPSSSSRVKATERFEAVYPTLRALALAGSPGTKTLKQVSQQLMPIAVRQMNENNADLSKEAASIFIWCLGENVDCYKQWEKLHVDDIEASVTVLRTLAGEWKEHAAKLSPYDTMKGTLKSLRLKNEQLLAGGKVDAGREACFREANKYCDVILARLARRLSCVKAGVLVLTLTIAAGAIILSPNVESWDWKNLHLMFSSSVLNIK